jgi:glycosyltransferase involved in cell wall biosynthesis
MLHSTAGKPYIIGLASPDPLNVYSETFIKAHAERLPCPVRLLHGVPLPTLSDAGPLPRSPIYRMLHKSIQHHRIRRLLPFPSDAFLVHAVRRFLTTQRIGIVLAEYGVTGACLAPLLHQLGIPLVVHFHGFDAYKNSTLNAYQTQYQQMFATARAVIAVSHDMERQLLQLGAVPERLHYNPYGIDTTLFASTDAGKNPPLFIGVGRFVDKKAPHLTLLAFQQVVHACPQARLILLGDGPLLESCLQLAAALGISEQVTFPGACSHEEVAATMQTARAFVQHSIRTSDGNSEGTPVAVLEAGMSGLPVVSTRHAGIKDAVIEGKTGFLVAERDIQGMAQYMIQLAQHAELATQLGQQARQHIVKHFSMEQHIDKLLQICDTAMAG